MSYTRVNWNSTSTYVSAENLNVMDKGIFDNFQAITTVLDNVGDITNLDTDVKTSVVASINSLNTSFTQLNNNLGVGLKIEYGTIQVSNIPASGQTDAILITFSKQFTEPPIVLVNCAGWGADLYSNCNDATTTIAHAYIRNTSLAAHDTTLQWVAIGV